MLYARLQLALPQVRTVLVAPPRSSLDPYPVAKELAALAAAAGCSVRLVAVSAAGEAPSQGRPDPSAATTTQDDIELLTLPEAGLGNVERLREILAPARDLTVVSAGGLLDSPVSILAASIVGGVVVVARPGKTTRSDLSRVKLDVERAGGRIAGAVMV